MTTMAATMASGRTRKIGDRTFEFRPLTLKDFGFLQRQALEDFKKQRIETYTKNLSLFPEAERMTILRAVVEETSRMCESDLPPQKMMMDKEGAVTLDKDKAEKTDVIEYAYHWMSFTYQGRLHAIWLSLHKAHPELTLDEVETLILDSNESVENLANVVGDLSSPSLGNGEAAPPTEKAGRGHRQPSTGQKLLTPSVSQEVTA